MKEKIRLYPYGYALSDLVNTAISSQEFMLKLTAIPAQKMLVLLNCCHAAGMELDKEPVGPLFTKALPPGAGGQDIDREQRSGHYHLFPS